MFEGRPGHALLQLALPSLRIAPQVCVVRIEGRPELVAPEALDCGGDDVRHGFVPQLRELPGFFGYYLLEAGNGVMSSISLFETAEQADESTKLVAQWITDENFKTAIPNAPKITSGKVVAHSERLIAVA